MTDQYEVRPQLRHGEPTGDYEVLENGVLLCVCPNSAGAYKTAAYLRQLTLEQQLKAIQTMYGERAA